MENSSSAGVFDRLCREIVRGHYAPGAHLPPERALATQLQTSRPTLREALRRLEEWRMIETRRGSGIVVRGRQEWSLQVLPTYVAQSLRAPGPDLRRMIDEILALRSHVYTEVLRLISDRAPNLSNARAKLEEAWTARREPAIFLRHDFDILRSLLAAAETLPALWLLNDIADVYLPLATLLGPAALPRADYHRAYSGMLDALERGDGEAAAQCLTAYLQRKDQDLLTAIAPPKISSRSTTDRGDAHEHAQ